MKTENILIIAAGLAAGYYVGKKKEDAAVGRINISVKKVYPIEGRRDFFKYVVMDNGEIAKGFQGNKWDVEMYFDNKEDAQRVADARRKVQRLNKKFSISGRKKKTLQVRLYLEGFKNGFSLIPLPAINRIAANYKMVKPEWMAFRAWSDKVANEVWYDSEMVKQVLIDYDYIFSENYTNVHISGMTCNAQYAL